MYYIFHENLTKMESDGIYVYVVILYIGTEKITERWLIGWHIFCFFGILRASDLTRPWHICWAHFRYIYIFFKKAIFYFSIPCTRLATTSQPSELFFLFYSFALRVSVWAWWLLDIDYILTVGNTPVLLRVSNNKIEAEKRKPLRPRDKQTKK